MNFQCISFEVDLVYSSPLGLSRLLRVRSEVAVNVQHLERPRNCVVSQYLDFEVVLNPDEERLTRRQGLCRRRSFARLGDSFF